MRVSWLEWSERHTRAIAFCLASACVLAAAAIAEPALEPIVAGCQAESVKAGTPLGLPLLLAEDFENGASRWQPTDPNAWRLLELDGNHVFALVRQSRYRPPYRSPANIALLKDLCVGDFVLEARVRTTTRDYPHRDMCVFFAYQDAAHFYYVHLGQRTDSHANQIFVVDGAPRTKISIRTTGGTPWDQRWHKVRVVRRIEDGTTEVYFDESAKPVMVARNKRFLWGRVGLGSFDDTGYWDDVMLWGKKVRPGSTERP